MTRPYTVKADNPGEVWLFHVTHIDNLASILQCGELRCHSGVEATHLSVTSIAYRHLQDRRKRITVPCGPGGNLHDYVPWHFAARPPMLFSIAHGSLGAGYKQDSVIHLVTRVQAMIDHDLACVYSDGHPLLQLSRFSDQLHQLPRTLDWPVLLDSNWANNELDRDRKRRRQAEFLVFRRTPWTVVKSIGVRTETMAGRVLKLLAEHASHNVRVRVVPEWYYDLT